MSAPCQVDEVFYCARHQRVHVGRLYDLSQMDNELGSSYRDRWDTEVQLGKKIGSRPAQAPVEARKGGAGTELRELLHKLGFEEKPGCLCRWRASVMDTRGPQWCRDNMDTILGWLREEAERQSLPFMAFATKQMVLLAIRRAEKKEKRNG